MASNIPRRRQPQAQSTTITPKSSKVQKQLPKGGSTLAERAADTVLCKNIVASENRNADPTPPQQKTHDMQLSAFIT
jgi:hypothetical protein